MDLKQIARRAPQPIKDIGTGAFGLCVMAAVVAFGWALLAAWNTAIGKPILAVAGALLFCWFVGAWTRLRIYW